MPVYHYPTPGRNQLIAQRYAIILTAIKRGVEAIKIFEATRKFKGPAINLLTFAAYLGAWSLYMLPLLRDISRKVSPNLGDPLFISWLIAWNQRWLLAHKFSLKALFNANIFYPFRQTLAFSDLMLIPSLITLPLRLLTDNPLIITNILLLLLLSLSTFAMYLLILELTGNKAVAFITGLLYGFSAYHLAQIGHIQLQVDGLLLLTALFLHRSLFKQQRHYLIYAALTIALLALSAWYYAVYAFLFTALFIIYFCYFGDYRLDNTFFVYLVAAVLLLVLIVVPFALPYLQLHQRYPDFQRSIGEASLYSAGPLDYLHTVKQNYLWGRWLGLGSPDIENVLFPGLGVIALALAALIALRKNHDYQPLTRRIIIFYFLTAVLALILSFGPFRKVDGRVVPLPYSVAYFLIPGFKIMRVPARFGLLVLLGLTVPAGYGLKLLFNRWRRRRRLTGWADIFLVGGLLLLVGQQISHPIVLSQPITSGKNIPAVYKYLARQNRYHSLIELPLDKNDAQPVYFSAYHFKKIVNGYSGYIPQKWLILEEQLKKFPSPATVNLLERLPIDLVLVHTEAYPGWQDAALEPYQNLHRLKKFGSDELYSLTDN